VGESGTNQPAASGVGGLRDLRKTGGRLQELEAKAKAYERSFEEKAALEARIRVLEQSLVPDTGLTVSNQLGIIETLSNRLSSVMERVVELEATTNAMALVIDEMALGNFEYYEAKGGDTFEAIAARVIIYGDASRGSWLRQFNRRRVRNPDKLEAGEVILIPRFRPGVTMPQL
jgi:nucleoid-associated protein YgaU